VRASKLVMLILILVLAAALINWVRSGDSTWHIAQSLPLLGGYAPDMYNLGGAAMLLITLWGLRRLRRQ
jgi:hypothetical protein